MRTAVSTAIRPFTDSDLDQLVPFLAEVYPGWQVDKDSARAYYDWKYCDLQGRDTGLPAGYIVEASNRIVGFLGCLPFTFRGKDTVSAAAWICDWHLSQTVRGQGLGRQLLERAITDIPVLACIGGSTDAVRLFRNFGFQSCVTGREWRQILRPLAFEWPRRDGWRRLAALPRAATSWCSSARWNGRINRRNLTIGPPVSPRDHAAVLLTSCTGPVRTCGYIEWLLRCPLVKPEMRLFYTGSEIAGWTILNTSTDWLRRKNSRVIDLEVTQTNLLAQAWSLCSHILRVERPVYITAIASPDSSAVYAAGFQPRGDVCLWVRTAQKVSLTAGKLHVTLLDKDNAFRGNTLIP